MHLLRRNQHLLMLEPNVILSELVLLLKLKLLKLLLLLLKLLLLKLLLKLLLLKLLLLKLLLKLLKLLKLIQRLQNLEMHVIKQNPNGTLHLLSVIKHLLNVLMRLVEKESVRRFELMRLEPIAMLPLQLAMLEHVLLNL